MRDHLLKDISFLTSVFILIVSCTKIDYKIPTNKKDTDTTTIDTAVIKLALQGIHNLTFTNTYWPAANPNNTQQTVDSNLKIEFNGNTFSVLNPPALPFYIPGGEGAYWFATGTAMNFINTRQFPVVENPGVILNGLWDFKSYNSYVIISRTNSYSILDTAYQSFSTYKILK